jgi:hypothetical protein
MINYVRILIVMTIVVIGIEYKGVCAHVDINLHVG